MCRLTSILNKRVNIVEILRRKYKLSEIHRRIFTNSQCTINERKTHILLWMRWYGGNDVDDELRIYNKVPFEFLFLVIFKRFFSMSFISRRCISLCRLIYLIKPDYKKVGLCERIKVFFFKIFRFLNIYFRGFVAYYIVLDSAIFVTLLYVSLFASFNSTLNKFCYVYVFSAYNLLSHVASIIIYSKSLLFFRSLFIFSAFLSHSD